MKASEYSLTSKSRWKCTIVEPLCLQKPYAPIAPTKVKRTVYITPHPKSPYVDYAGQAIGSAGELSPVDFKPFPANPPPNPSPDQYQEELEDKPSVEPYNPPYYKPQDPFCQPYWDAFYENPYPNIDECKELSQRLNLSPKIIQQWFALARRFTYAPDRGPITDSDITDDNESNESMAVESEESDAEEVSIEGTLYEHFYHSVIPKKSKIVTIRLDTEPTSELGWFLNNCTRT
ncbi:unnamed protein product, partial [Rhizoctonia solani]